MMRQQRLCSAATPGPGIETCGESLVFTVGDDTVATTPMFSCGQVDDPGRRF
ncbi:MAG: hypothetical protein HKN35_09065 [Woeseia sp.]|nr:hypothetical protein [Woeseia sp.]MBT8095481.1 hypothetical protein [Woeseia sp.]NNE61032.1 hypothetical protein [Woeseia sp.]NNL55020.1 hypothetical protein [Woeseia sp.]